MQTEFLINTGVIAHISIIDVCYVVTEKKYYLICFPRELSQTSAGNGNVTRVTKMWIFLHIEINPWKLALKVVILLLLTVFSLGVFSMARRHALVSLRHALVSLRHAAPSQRHAALFLMLIFFFFFFFFRPYY